MIERKFVAKGIRKAELEDYLESQLENADYSHSEIKRTPLSTRVLVYAGRPGMVIGRSGSKIKEITEAFASKFGVSNPQIEVKAVENQYLDAAVVAKQIAYSLERGMNYRRTVNIFLENIMGSGAIGVEICLAGKLSGARKRREKFLRGHLKKSGDSRELCTQLGKATAELKPGTIGVKVRIMHSLPDVLLIEKRMKALKEGKDKKAGEEEKEKAGVSGEKTDVEAPAAPETPKTGEESAAADVAEVLEAKAEAEAKPEQVEAGKTKKEKQPAKKKEKKEEPPVEEKEKEKSE